MEKIKELLMRSFDETLSEQDQRKLDEALNSSAELRREKEKISAMREMLTAGRDVKFNPMFAERVMNRLPDALRPVQEPDLFSALFHMFKRVVFAGAIAVVILASVQLVVGLHDRNNIQNPQISNMSLDDVLATAFSASMEDLL